MIKEFNLAKSKQATEKLKEIMAKKPANQDVKFLNVSNSMRLKMPQRAILLKVVRQSPKLFVSVRVPGPAQLGGIKYEKSNN